MSGIFFGGFLMKKFLAFAISLIAIVACAFLVACGKVEPVVITATNESYDFNGKTLIDYMTYLQDEGDLTFEIKDGMVTSINGKSNTAKSYWMLYTDDAENANEAWGTFEHEGKTYGSAVAGVSELKIKENCVYIWTYQTF